MPLLPYMDGALPTIAGICSLLRTRQLGVCLGVAQWELKPGLPLTDSNLSHRSQLLFVSRAWVLLLVELCVPLASPASHVSLWLSLFLPFLFTCRLSPTWMDQGVCVVNGMMPFLWRALLLTHSHAPIPFSPLVRLLCYSRLSVKMYK